jgi:hypothetical protein
MAVRMIRSRRMTSDMAGKHVRATARRLIFHATVRKTGLLRLAMRGMVT